MNQTIYERPVELLQNLIRFDTTNPPGNETECIHYVAELLRAAGIEYQTYGRTPERQNLIARLPGRGEAPPILLQGHVDVVTTKGQQWQHPPFEGLLIDGEVWGRGALDDKGHVTMLLSALLRAKASGLRPPGDVILAVVADEENNAHYGAKYLVEEHPELFEGVRYAIGEGGGFSVWISQKKFYPIMVAEKQICSVRVTTHGPGGHGAQPIHNTAMARMAAVLHTLDRQRLPVHIGPVTQQMLETISGALPFPKGLVMRQLLNPALCDRILDLLGKQGELISPLLHNTVSPTIVRGGEKINVIPSEISLDLDGRLLPGQTPDDMLRELRGILGADVDLVVTNSEPGPPPPDMARYATLAELVREADPEGTPHPFLVNGVTDARHFAKLGIQSYGFSPMNLPPNDLLRTVHGADERIPVSALEFGAQVSYQLLERFKG